jgi:sterol 3beta-glucosyltransferase
MARILLASHGTIGDLFPFLALGLELQRAGHEPSLVVDRSYASTVESHGLRCVPVDTGRDERRFLEGLMRELLPLWNPLTQLARSIEEIYVATTPAFRAALLREAPRADLLVSNAVTFAGAMVHEETAIPIVSVFLGHVLKSSYYPPPAPPPFRTFYPKGPLARLVNRAIWELAERTAGRLLGGVNRLRRAEGLKPVESFIDLPPPGGPCLVTVSRVLAEEMPDWPRHFRVTGFLFHHPNIAYEPEAELLRFLREGDAPVVFSFGSMAGIDADHLTRTLLEALEAAGRPRAIIQAGWADLGSRALPPHVRSVGFAPHDWLFSQASCVVHHGGAGTSGAVLRAGVPSVVVCCWNDQMLWAAELRRIGVAGGGLTFARLTPERLGKAIRKTLDSSAMRARAEELGALVAREDGARAARCAIEETLGSAGR